MNSVNQMVLLDRDRWTQSGIGAHKSEWDEGNEELVVLEKR